MSVQMIDCVREGEEEALRYLEGIWQKRLATFIQNDGNINVRDEEKPTRHGELGKKNVWGLTLVNSQPSIFWVEFL